MQRTYFVAESLKEVEDAGIGSPDSMLGYVARQMPPGLPPHSLTIKVNVVYRLMRNMSIDHGLVKNVCIVVVVLGHHLITVRILCGIDGANFVFESEDILIPRIALMHIVSNSSPRSRLCDNVLELLRTSIGRADQEETSDESKICPPVHWQERPNLR